jgi:hypothetical protein
LKNGMGPSFGNMLVADDREATMNKFALLDLVTNSLLCIFAACSAVLIMPFVRLYTSHVTDVNYEKPLFAMVLIIAMMLGNMKHPYLMVLSAAGHFRQTKTAAYIEMMINAVLSLILVRPFGLVGVALASIAAMTYRVVYSAWYLSRNILCYPMRNLFIKLAINLGIMTLSYLLLNTYGNDVSSSYLQWTIFAVIAVVAISFMTLVAYGLVYMSKSMQIIRYVNQMFFRRGRS